MGVCVRSNQCADSLLEINLRNTESVCPIGELCCQNLKSIDSPEIAPAIVSHQPPKIACIGLCVSKEHCPGPSEINLRLNNQMCPSNQVCCKNPQFLAPSTDKLHLPMPWGPVVPPSGDFVNSQKSTEKQFFECTLQNDPRTSYINKADVPWLVTIWSNRKSMSIDGNQYECVGTMLRADMILTAADCVADASPELLYARVGDFNLQPINTLSKRREFYIERIAIHPDYDVRSGHANVAVLHLGKNATNKGTVCLSQYGDHYSDADCFLIGWNKLSVTSKVIADAIPEKHFVKLNQNSSCPESVICTDQHHTAEKCDNFQGSPLVCFANGGRSWKQVGLVSKTSNWCDSAAVPSSFIAIGSHEMWIREQIAPSFQQMAEVPKPSRVYLPVSV
ncbi:phenoloxidase-activating factor 2-like [Topomyia yanbarensis]|uniref:phenoloxidase-activating factor 2-like n=1 Tax=Topomyia yanbarensis TaxID=2498891 RepID=UPI00273B5A29|nr:phenoloxidase-activating factor 2-like [Topomyia yanbarensis]